MRKQLKGTAQRKLRLEHLEPRHMLTTWLEMPVNQDWSNPDNWSDGAPTPMEPAVFTTDAGTVVLTGMPRAQRLTIEQKSVTLDMGPTLETGAITVADIAEATLTLSTMGKVDTNGRDVQVGKVGIPGHLNIINGAELDLRGAMATGKLTVTSGSLMIDGNVFSGETVLGSAPAAGATNVEMMGLSWDISGDLTVAGGTEMLVNSGTVTVSGTTAIQSAMGTPGKLSVDVGGTVKMIGGGTNDGELKVATGGELEAVEDRIINRGKVFAGESPGQFTVIGDFEQTSVGTAFAELGGTTAVTQYDVYDISGTATLGGTLDVSFINNFGNSIQVGNFFDVFVAGDIVDEFDNLPEGIYTNNSAAVQNGELPALNIAGFPDAAWKVTYGDMDNDPSNEEVRLEVINTQTNKLFEVHGRWGNNKLNGDWEIGLTDNTNQPPESQENFVWQQLQPVDFSFDISELLNASYDNGGAVVSHDYGADFKTDVTEFEIWAQAIKPGSSLILSNLMLDGMPIAPIIVDADPLTPFPEFQTTGFIGGFDFSDGVTLTGTVTMDWDSMNTPRGSRLQFHLVARGAVEDTSESSSAASALGPIALASAIESDSPKSLTLSASDNDESQPLAATVDAVFAELDTTQYVPQANLIESSTNRDRIFAGDADEWTPIEDDVLDSLLVSV